MFTRVPALELPKELVLVKTLMWVTGIEFSYIMINSAATSYLVYVSMSLTVTR